MGNGVSVGEVKLRGKKRWVVNLGSGAARRRRFFRSAAAANTYADSQREEVEGYGGVILALTAAQRAALAEGLRRLETEGDGASVLEAVEFYLQHHKASRRSTIADAVKEFLKAKRIAGRRDEYVRTLKSHLGMFERHVGPARMVHTITLVDVEDWLDGRKDAVATRRSVIIDLRTFFRFCQARGYCQTNPAGSIDLPMVDESKANPLKVDDVQRLLTAMREGLSMIESKTGKAVPPDLDILRYTVCQLFGFLRTCEARRITEAEIREDVIDCTGAAAKKRYRRLIEVNDTLRAWLLVGGRLPVRNLKRRQKVFRDAVFGSGNWPHNGLRDTYCTYAFVVFGGKDTAQQSGHSEDMLMNRYRAVTSRAEAERYWGLRPS